MPSTHTNQTLPLSEKTCGGKVINRAAPIVEVKGKRAVKLNEHAGMGAVWLNGYDFENEVIDADLLGRSQPAQGSFVGFAVHVIDTKTCESVGKI